MSDHISFACVEVEQPIGSFYVGVIPAADVLAIASADVRRIEQRDIERIVGIQRELVPNRVRELKAYVKTVDATFPTSIILAIDEDKATFDPKSKTMRVRREPNAAKIIDGQHRIAGLEEFGGEFELPVTIFIDMDPEDQAMTFATINLKQTKVSKSLVYDLYEFQKSRSPTKTCHNIARLMNKEEGSPFRNRIKILGKATGEPFQYVTQATFVTQLLRYLSKDPMADRDTIKRGKKLEPLPIEPDGKLMFRDLFIQEKDAVIARVVWNFFEAVSKRWPTAWSSAEAGFILNRTTGFTALMRFLGPVYLRSKEPDGRLTPEATNKVLKRITLKAADFTAEKYLPGGSGTSELLQNLMEQAGLPS